MKQTGAECFSSEVMPAESQAGHVPIEFICILTSGNSLSQRSYNECNNNCIHSIGFGYMMMRSYTHTRTNKQETFLLEGLGEKYG